MSLLYNISIFFLGLGLRIASLFNPKAKLWVKGRTHLFQELPNVEGKKVIWFHCASLGEFDQGLPLMNKIKENDPSVFLIVTFFSPSGMQHYQKRSHKADHVCYIPLDTPSKAKKFIKAIQPVSAFFIKYEFWTNHILACKNNGTKIYNVSGIFRQDHRFFKSSGGFFRKTLRRFDWFFVQNEESLNLLNSIGIKQVSISGDSRFDKVSENKANLEKNATISKFCGNEIVFIIGSSWPKDEEILLPIINQLKCKVIIAPHNIDESHVKGITNKLERSFVRYSDEASIDNQDVLILDTIGHLSSAYAFGSVAYVGGGFSGSLHNILEPAVFGMGVIYGPKHSRFPEARQFIENGFGFEVSTSDELKSRIEAILLDKEDIDDKAADFVQKNIGASDRIFGSLRF
ncbi:MAG: 3-deoxy-D-manno-octulosonic-acid transferase [Crocinitomicaceae bacterium]|jgi:3-deoxy-D-manno-octulosonic-acid transferase